MSEELRRLSKRKLVGLVEQLMNRVEALEGRLQHLERRNADLEAEVAKARKNSATSSKPPSSDMVKPPKLPASRRTGQRKAGGQPGHAKHERTPFTPDQLDGAWEYPLTACKEFAGVIGADYFSECLPKRP